MTTPDTLAKLAARVCLDVAELPDRNSPEDWPEAMLVTADELRDIVLSALTAQAPAAAEPVAWQAQQFIAPVYPPDGTTSPFTVINLGSGQVQMGDSIHDQRLPALWFGINGQGMGHEVELNREAMPGETLAVVTFSNVNGLDVLLDVIQRIRREKFPQAAQKAAQAPEGLTLTIAEIRDLAGFAGLLVKESAEPDEDEQEAELTITPCPPDGVADDEGRRQITRFVAHFTDIPEEGCLGLGPLLAARPQAEGSQG